MLHQVHLKHLEVKSNYLKYLPYNIGCMTALKVVFYSFLPPLGSN